MQQRFDDRAAGASSSRRSDEATTQLAAIVHPRGFHLDALLASLCDELRGSGLKLGGILQAEHRDCSEGLQVTDLSTGARFEIWQELGREATSCRLDERGLTEAVPAVMKAIASRVDLVVINRFGKAESHGGGLISAIAAAIEAGIPVITAVRAPYTDAWREFHHGLAIDLPPSLTDAATWCRGAVANARKHAS